MGGMSGQPCQACVSFLCLLVALVGRSWCPVAPGCCPGRLRFFRECFSVTSEVELKGQRPEYRQFFCQVPPAAVKPDGWASVGCSGTSVRSPRGVAAPASLAVAAAVIVSEETLRRLEGRLLQQRQFVLSVDKADCCVAPVAAAARPFPQVHNFLRERFLLAVLPVVLWPVSTLSGAVQFRWRPCSVAWHLFCNSHQDCLGLC